MLSTVWALHVRSPIGSGYSKVVAGLISFPNEIEVVMQSIENLSRGCTRQQVSEAKNNTSIQR